MKSRRDDADSDRDEAVNNRAAMKAKDNAEEEDDGSTTRKHSRDEEDEDSTPTKRGKASMDDEAAAGDDEDAPINLADADENATGKGEVVPRGRYLCQVSETEFVEFKTGSKGMKVKLEVVEGEYAAGGQRKRGKVFFTNVVASAKAADMLKAALKGLGVSKKVYNSPNFRISTLRALADEGDLVGNEVVVEVKIRNYEGEKQNEVRRMMLPSEAGGGDVAKGGRAFLED
jgi:hypothetical protein